MLSGYCLTRREWTTAQIAEKEHHTQEEKHADRLYHLKACELDQRAVDLAAADEETRRNISIATKEYNLALVHIIIPCTFLCYYVASESVCIMVQKWSVAGYSITTIDIELSEFEMLKIHRI